MSKRIRKETNNQRKNTKFGQDRRRHSKRGVTSCLFAVTGLSALVGLFTTAYKDYGKGNGIIGAISIILLIFSMFATSVAIKGFKEREKNYITCKIGATINALLTTVLVLLYMRGLA